MRDKFFFIDIKNIFTCLLTVDVKLKNAWNFHSRVEKKVFL